MADAEPTGPSGDGTGWVRWRLELRVEPLHGEPFAARACADLPAGERPAIGGRVEVLHDPRPRSRLNRADRGGPIEPLLLGAPPRAVASPSHPPTPAPPPLAEVLRELARGLGDGSLAAGMPIVMSHDAPVADAPHGDATEPPRDGYRRLGLEALAAHAGRDAAGVADEVARRLDAGEATPAQLLLAASTAGLAPEDVLAVLAAVRGGRVG